ncbi:MAG: ParB N-terminal domain-containing protein [Paracoccaceae bacterium]
MLQSIIIKISDVYIPADRKKELDPVKVENFAENLLNEGELKPIRVRKGKGRYVLVGGVNRLSAHEAVGEDTIEAYVVSARQF